jgi:UDP-N-acetylglucosamine 2-epimerase (non-hydrolysing)
MKVILSVVGTRPEAIKMAPVIMALRRDRSFRSYVCTTGQHREMLDSVFSLFDIRPDWDLGIMTSRQDLYDVTSRVLLGMKDVISSCSPDAVLVHGDTATTLSASIASYYQCKPVGHVEAGLRTRDIYSPWPEEMNRQVVGRIAAWHFAPTPIARRNLMEEGIAAPSIVVTGNTVIDALQWVSKRLSRDESLRAEQRRSLLPRLGFDPESDRYILVTGHRRENHGNGLLDICRALKRVANEHQDVRILYPVHPNPAVREPVYRILAGIHNVSLIDPVDYLPFVYLMQNCDFVLTDSGGIQEEAPSLGKPVLVMRNTTERPEAVGAGTVRLVGTHYGTIIDEVNRLLTDSDAYHSMSTADNPYGDGSASDQIVHFLRERLHA